MNIGYIPPDIMIPPGRLGTLLEQAISSQELKCLYHNVSDNSFTLLNDHRCLKSHIPTESTSFIGHCDEIWCVAFSNSGNYLASSAKDGSIIVWDVTQANVITFSFYIYRLPRVSF